MYADKFDDDLQRWGPCRRPFLPVDAAIDVRTAVQRSVLRDWGGQWTQRRVDAVWTFRGDDGGDLDNNTVDGDDGRLLLTDRVAVTDAQAQRALAACIEDVVTEAYKLEAAGEYQVFGRAAAARDKILLSVDSGGGVFPRQASARA